MREIATIHVIPDKRMVGLLTAGLKALCDRFGLDRDKTLRLQLAVEEVFLYCLSTLQENAGRSRITARYFHTPGGFMIILEYSGPRGRLDRYLRPGMLGELKVKTFEGLGLCLASNLLDDLRCDHWASQDINRYILTFNFDTAPPPPEKTSGLKDAAAQLRRDDQ